MESLEFKYGLDIHFCYNGNLGTLQQKTKDNKRLVYCLLYNKVITKEEYEQLVKEIVAYFQEQIQSVIKNPLYFIDQHLTTQLNHVIVKKTEVDKMKVTLYDDNYCCIEYDTQENQCFYADLMLSFIPMSYSLGKYIASCM